MSLDEAQLRAALHEGEGDTVDAGLLIANAYRVRQERRHRRNMLAAAALVVGLVGAGSALVLNRGGEEAGSSSSGGGAAAGNSNRGDYGAGTGAASSLSAQGQRVAKRPSPASAPFACPRVPDRLTVPTTATQNRSIALLPEPVLSIRVCSYPSGAPLRSERLGDGAARALAASLNAGSTRSTLSPRSCARSAPVGTVEMLPVGAGGRAARPVVLTATCRGAVATNGATVRYFAEAPSLLRDLIR